MSTARRWDIFCQVIDNHGDLGVCWRLARQLAAEGESVRLWVDDSRALAWMAPEGTGAVQLVHWGDAQAEARALAEPAPEVLIEAFGCNPSPTLVAQFAQAAQAGGRHAWINLEYLSAEPVVQRLHGLPSLVSSGPGAGLTKHFFYPGFTPATGGLLREADLAQRQALFDRAAWLATHGIARQAGERLFSLFCYEPAALGTLLGQLAHDATPTRLLVTAGRATAAVRQVLATQAPSAKANGPAMQWGRLALHFLPALPQPAYDELLWACELNFVRGEDSFVRAHWAGALMVWHIYPQDEDDAHHAKLAAWLDWLRAPAWLRQVHQAWNGIDASATTAAAALGALSDPATLAEGRACMEAARSRLQAQPDLLTQLRRFVTQKS